jgi:hypothetical protein
MMSGDGMKDVMYLPRRSRGASTLLPQASERQFEQTTSEGRLFSALTDDALTIVSEGNPKTWHVHAGNFRLR